jgi:hypothetical protein
VAQAVASIMPSFLVLVLVQAVLMTFVLNPLYFNTLSAIPGQKLYTVTKWRLAWDDWTGQRTRKIHALHRKYGPVVRIGPNEVHFNSLSALRAIYGAGSGFERTSFYSMFDVYGRKNLFTFASGSDHAKRKRLLAHTYLKSSLGADYIDHKIRDKIRDCLWPLDAVTNGGEGSVDVEIFTALHYYAIDVITTFLHGTGWFGATSALRGTPEHRALLNDIMDPARRRLSWFAVHFPSLTRWMYSRTGFIGRLGKPFLPMAEPVTYTGIRAWALRAMETYRESYQEESHWSFAAKGSVICELYDASYRCKEDLDDLDIASECADHLLAGIDSTSDTLMFLIWCLSLPQNADIQQKLTKECRSMPDWRISKEAVSTKIPADKLPYLNAVIKETLRLFAPLPASEPRSSPVDTVVDGYSIPQGTVCSMAPYSLHRNEDVFPEPLKWKPERWLIDDKEKLVEMERWFWAFSSGARMCIGMQLVCSSSNMTLLWVLTESSLAMAEMALVPSLYRKYRSTIKP